MKYLVVVEYFFEDTPGGSGRVAWDIARMMKAADHEVTMLVYRQEDQQAGEDEFEGINIVRFDKKSLPSWHPGRLRAIIDSAEQAASRYLSDTDWDVIHIHTPLIGAGVMSALGNDNKYVVTTHSPIVQENEIIWKTQGIVGRIKCWLGRPALRRIEKRVLRRANRIHTLSSFTRDIVDSDYGVGSKVNVIPHWYEASVTDVSKQQARDRLGWPRDKKIMFTVRGMRPRYGIDVAIRAAAACINERDDVLFYIGGSGPMRNQLEQLSKNICPEGQIKFLGRLSDEDLELAYIASDLFILPTLALECYGLIIVEAMAHGCPVISSDAGAIPEIMSAILPELVVIAGDEGRLREVMKQCLEGSPSTLSSDKLKDFVDKNYSKKVVADQLQQMLLK